MTYLDRIEETVVREIRLAGLLNEPAPNDRALCDLDAEAELCSAAMAGDVVPSELDLPGSEFYSDLLAHVWVAVDALDELGREPTVEMVLVALDASGFRGPLLEREVERIRWAQPYASPEGIRARAARIRELARKRRLLKSLERLTLDVRMGLALSEARITLERLAGL